MGIVELFKDDNINKQVITAVLEKLISLESDSSKKEEGNVGQYIFSFFENLGIEVSKQDCGDNRFNVKAVIKGKNNSRKLMYCGHMDCVPGGPYQSYIKDGRMYGRGSCDMKGSLACVMFMAEYFVRNAIIPENDIILLFDADEEVANAGLKTYLKSPDENVGFIIVGEPSESSICVGHRGVAAFTVTVSGLSAHVGNASLGINAVYCASDIIQAVIEHNKYLSENRSSFIGASSLHVTQIHGGERVNVVPDKVVLRLDKRMILGEDLNSSLGELEGIVKQVCMNHKCSYTVASTTYCPPSMLDVNNPILKNLQKTAKDLGFEYPLVAFPATCEAGLLNSNLNVPVAILGPGSIQQAHKPDEYVELKQLYNVAEVYISFFKDGLV